MVRDVVLPHARPEIFTGIRLAVGVAYSSVVAAETINGVPGIGGMVRHAQRYSQTDVVVLGLFAIGLRQRCRERQCRPREGDHPA